ncbi:MAG: presenilin family intramembrane aspartyl protease [Candidatus Bathyarchaeia archaeon]
MKGEFKTEPVQLLPVLGSLVFGIVCAYLVLTSDISLYAVTPFPEGPESLINALYFVILAGIGATLLYLLIKRKKLRAISLITGFALTAAILMLSIFYLSAVFSLLAVSSTAALILTLAVAASVTALADFAIFKVQGRISNLVILLLGGALGAFLGISIPIISAVLILAFLAIYDVFAVYRGPVGKIAQQGLDQLRGLSFSFRDVQMGLGDLTFYSMLTGLVLANAGPIFCAVSAIGIMAGVLLVLKMLEKRGMFPGLPFPVFLGLLPLIIYLLLSR